MRELNISAFQCFRKGKPQLSGKQQLKKFDITCVKSHHIPGLFGHSRCLLLVAFSLKVQKHNSVSLDPKKKDWGRGW